jgi:hypothetical protein
MIAILALSDQWLWRVMTAIGSSNLLVIRVFKTIPKLSICVEEICDRNFTESLEDPNMTVI